MDTRDIIAAAIRHRLTDAQQAHRVDVDFAIDVLAALDKAGMRIIPCAPLPGEIAEAIEYLKWLSSGSGSPCLKVIAVLEQMAQENAKLKETIDMWVGIAKRTMDERDALQVQVSDLEYELHDAAIELRG